jgi:uncharacterized protein involved in exopolysaccharide biosynthesis
VTWLDEEPSLVVVGYQQVRRAIKRARRRPWVTVSLAVSMAGLLLAIQARRPKQYRAEVGLLITEGVIENNGLPRPRGELRALVNDAIFVTARLEGLVDKHGLVKKLGESSKAAAVARVKKLIEVEVWQDYLVSYRDSTDPPRSARVAIGFSAPDPSTSLKVAQELGEMVAETQTASETNVADARIAGYRAIAKSAAAMAARHSEQIGREIVDALDHPTPYAALRLRELKEASRVAEDASQFAAADLFNAELQRREMEKFRRRLVKVVDPGIPVWQTVSSGRPSVRRGVLSLGLTLALAVLLVGTFDPTVRDEQDLRRAGLLPLGSIRVCGDSFSGGEV